MHTRTASAGLDFWDEPLPVLRLRRLLRIAVPVRACGSGPHQRRSAPGQRRGGRPHQGQRG